MPEEAKPALLMSDHNSYYSVIQFPRTVKKQNANKKPHSIISVLALSLQKATKHFILDSSPSSCSVWIKCTIPNLT